MTNPIDELLAAVRVVTIGDWCSGSNDNPYCTCDHHALARSADRVRAWRAREPLTVEELCAAYDRGHDGTIRAHHHGLRAVERVVRSRSSS